ncbi:MAG: tRNA dihydrouridine synthase DusB [Gammaproteobacteria bacterium]|nr:tRNA dihydrouridine synthase DusB [Gammaproteobacteria bacterium]
MQIGPYKLRNNLILAPMAGVTDLPFRKLCREFGAGMAVSEMVSTDASLRGSRKTVLRLDHTDEPEPVSVQIVGTDPLTMAEAAKANIDHGAQIIDINMGCPAKKVCKVAAGSALLKDEKLVQRILEAIVNAVDVPVTLKIRTGWDQQNKNAAAIAHIAEQSGIQALAIHGRTRACGYSGEAEYQTIRAVKDQVKIPVIANGDITSPEKALEVITYTAADAIMIGRAAQGRPWIFQEIQHFLDTGSKSKPISIEKIKKIMLKHLDNLYTFYGEYLGVRIARKHIGWYSRTQPESTAFRKTINQVQTPEQQQALIQAYFDTIISTRGMAA